MFAAAVRQGSSVYCWKTTLRSRPGPVIGVPSTVSGRRLGVASPAIRSSTVDLPQPGRADEGQELPRRDVQVEVVERDELAQLLVVVAADPEGLADVAQLDA